MLRRCLLCVLVLTLAGCSSLPSWMGGGKKEFTPLPGERIAVLPDNSALRPDASIETMKVDVPAPLANSAWTQHMGNAASNLEHALFSGTLKTSDRVTAGKGTDFEQMLVAPPIVAESKVFAMDGAGRVSAHGVKDITHVQWKSRGTATEDDDPVYGGGLAYEAGHVFVTSGRGLIVALKAASGEEIWRQTMGVAMRAAPKAEDGVVYAISVDNQLFALNAVNGSVLWTHRGISETAGFLSAVSPSVSNGVVVAPYSSGEIHVLRAADGTEIWSDSLALTRHTLAVSSFTGIGGDPVIASGMVIAVSNEGVLAAAKLETGQRLWEQPISSLNTPWVAGDFVYVLSTDYILFCLLRTDGRIRWTRALRSFEDEANKEGPLHWSGPVMAGGKLLIAGAHGEMLMITPADGSIARTVTIPDGVYSPPVVAGDTLYLMDKDAKLHAFR